jgi:beta-galactosidase
LLLTPRSGVKDEANAVFDGPLPGLLAEIAGSSVEEYDSLPPGCRAAVRFGPGETGEFETGVWCEALRPTTAAVLARYAGGWLDGAAAVTENASGAGRVVYAGVYGDAAFYSALAGFLLPAQVSPLGDTPGLEVTTRADGGRRLVFVLNHTGRPQPVNLPPDWRVLLGPADARGPTQIPARDVWILEQG